jgi:hypothetical protein
MIFPIIANLTKVVNEFADQLTCFAIYGPCETL